MLGNDNSQWTLLAARTSSIVVVCGCFLKILKLNFFTDKRGQKKESRGAPDTPRVRLYYGDIDINHTVTVRYIYACYLERVVKFLLCFALLFTLGPEGIVITHVVCPPPYHPCDHSTAQIFDSTAFIFHI